jgi:hypothetical protein
VRLREAFAHLHLFFHFVLQPHLTSSLQIVAASEKLVQKDSQLNHASPSRINLDPVGKVPDNTMMPVSGPASKRVWYAAFGMLLLRNRIFS